MNPASELREIVRLLKSRMVAEMKTGLDPPSLSPSIREYLLNEASRHAPLEGLRRTIGECRRCRLWKERSGPVFGEGPLNARLLFVGEAPGYDDDLAGRPFAGEAGELLDKIIEAMGLKRGDVYLCNVVKCHPPGDRDPAGDEIGSCIPFLDQQLDVIRPEIICYLGSGAGQALFGHDFEISAERGRWRSYKGIPAMPTYHPSYVLSDSSKVLERKRQVWSDVRLIMSRLCLEVRRNG